MGVVLSVIGAILLKLLEIILILVLLVIALLFLPIRYRFNGSYDGELRADIRVSWIFHLVSFRMKVAEETSMKFRLFGVDMAKFLAKTKAQKEKRRKRKTEKERSKQSRQKKKKRVRVEKMKASGKGDIELAQASKVSKADEDGQKMESDGANPKNSESQRRESHGENSESQRKESHSDDSKSQETQGKDRSGSKERYKKKDNAFVKIWGRIQSIMDFFKAIPKLLSKIRDKVAWSKEVRVFIVAENTKRMVCILKDNMIHLWRKLKPKRLKGNIYFGTGDPASTGQILGMISILYAYYGASVEVKPDFEHARLEGKLYFRGRVSLITILMIVVRLLMSREWNQFRRDAERLKEAF